LNREDVLVLDRMESHSDAEESSDAEECSEAEECLVAEECLDAEECSDAEEHSGVEERSGAEERSQYDIAEAISGAARHLFWFIRPATTRLVYTVDLAREDVPHTITRYESFETWLEAVQPYRRQATYTESLITRNTYDPNKILVSVTIRAESNIYYTEYQISSVMAEYARRSSLAIPGSDASWYGDSGNA
jgi:hypothetical protein